MMKKIFKNKKAVIAILESVIAIFLMEVVLLLVIEQNSSQKEEISEAIYSAEIGLLRSVQINENYRKEILSTSGSIYWDSDSFPSEIKEEIESKKLSYLECAAKICEINSTCEFEESIEKDIYVQSAFISANAMTYSPKELKIFCWEK
jgi:hypothetical protein